MEQKDLEPQLVGFNYTEQEKAYLRSVSARNEQYGYDNWNYSENGAVIYVKEEDNEKKYKEMRQHNATKAHWGTAQPNKINEGKIRRPKNYIQLPKIDRLNFIAENKKRAKEFKNKKYNK